jgi:hypothetical protein
MKYAIATLALALALAACSPAETTTPAPDTQAVEPAIVDVVTAAMPGVEIINGAADGEGEYEVTGTLNGQDYEFDLMGPDGGWRVVQIQRDIAWADAPEPVRQLIAANPNAFVPERVIESRQPADDSVIYILSSPSASEAVEVRLMDGEAAVMPPAH